jgi:alanine racemase
MNQTQFEAFNTITDNKDNRSMANSAAILSLPESLFDVVRPGIMLYGASPFNDNHFTLKPAMQLSAPIVSIKTLQADSATMICHGFNP